MFKSRLFYPLWVSKDISRTIKDILHLENFSRELTRENFKVGKIKFNLRLKLESVGLLGRSWASLLDGRSHLAITLQCVNLGHLILLVFFIISRCSYWLNQKKKKPKEEQTHCYTAWTYIIREQMENGCEGSRRRVLAASVSCFAGYKLGPE